MPERIAGERIVDAWIRAATKEPERFLVPNYAANAPGGQKPGGQKPGGRKSVSYRRREAVCALGAVAASTPAPVISVRSPIGTIAACGVAPCSRGGLPRRGPGGRSRRRAGGPDRTYSPDRTGGAEGNRTPDLLNAIQALSQLSYGPVHRRRRDVALFSGVIKQEYAPLWQIIAVSCPCPPSRCLPNRLAARMKRHQFVSS